MAAAAVLCGLSLSLTAALATWRRTVNSVSFTVSSVTMAGSAYVQAGNHDPDGSNGTVIKVNRP